MGNRDEFPSTLSPVNLKAYLELAFGGCGCSELDAMVEEIVRLLVWHAAGEGRPPWTDLYPDRPGMFYLMAGRVDALGLAEHGVSIRHAFLTERGKRLLAALRETPVSEIEGAGGRAYDGLWYGDGDESEPVDAEAASPDPIRQWDRAVGDLTGTVRLTEVRDRMVVEVTDEMLAPFAGIGVSPEERWWWAGGAELGDSLYCQAGIGHTINVRGSVEYGQQRAIDVYGDRVAEAERRARQVLSAMRLAAALFDGPAGIERHGNPELAARGIEEGAREHDLDAIAAILNEEEEAQDACARIADVLRQSGREITPDWNLGEEL